MFFFADIVQLFYFSPTPANSIFVQSRKFSYSLSLKMFTVKVAYGISCKLNRRCISGDIGLQ